MVCFKRPAKFCNQFVCLPLVLFLPAQSTSVAHSYRVEVVLPKCEPSQGRAGVTLSEVGGVAGSTCWPRSDENLC